MIKRLTAFVLILALTGPLGLVGGSEASSAANTSSTLASEHRFSSSTTVTPPQSGGVDIVKHTPDLSVPASKSNVAWVNAGIELLNARSNGVVNNITPASPAANGNRATLTAYLMHTAENGPFVAGVDRSRPVTGVVHIPDSSNRTYFINNVKRAVLTNGAVAASMLFNENRMYEDKNESIKLYHNTSTANTNHIVVITGWDDDMAGTFTPVYNDEVPDVTLPSPGAFRVRDSRYNEDYWVSYGTPLINAFFIDDLFAENTFRPDDKNLIGHTYHHDRNGLNGVISTGHSVGAVVTTEFANVFTTNRADGAFRLQAVSVFLAGENNTVNVYLIRDYKEEKDLENYKAGIRIVTDAKRDLPGYYTFHITPAELGHERFAIVAEVAYTHITGSGVPTSSTAPASGGSSFMFRNGAWTRTNNGLCVKAHAETKVEIGLTGIELPKNVIPSPNPDGIADEIIFEGINRPLLSVSPNQTRTLNIIRVPANATDMLPSETEWRVFMPSEERDPVRGWLILDDGKPVIEAASWHIWHEGMKIFVPEDIHDTLDPFDTWQANRAWDSEADRFITVADYKPLITSVGITNNGLSFRASNDQSGHNQMILFEAKAHTGEKDVDGKWVQESGKYKRVQSFTAYTVVRIEPTPITGIRLNRSTATTMRAGATMNFSAVLEPGNASQMKVDWFVVGALTTDTNAVPVNTGGETRYYEEAATFNPLDPFSPTGPVATINENGRVTALRAGEFNVFARVAGHDSNVVNITVASQATTGVNVSRRRHTMSAGTTVTINSTVRPAGASNRRVTWSIKDGEPAGIVTIVNAQLGIIRAEPNASGTVTLVVTPEGGGTPVECVIIVTSLPSATVNIDRNANYTVLGATTGDTVVWDWFDSEGLELTTPLPSGFPFAHVPQNGNRYRVRAESPNEDAVMLRGRVVVPNPLSPEDRSSDLTIREQTWTLHAVEPLARIAFMDGDRRLTRIVLGIKPGDTDGSTGQISEDGLTVSFARPDSTGGTLLPFEWSARQVRDRADRNKWNDVVDFMTPVMDGDTIASFVPAAQTPTGSTIYIRARSVGTTRVTGINHNGRRRVNISVRVLLFPEESNITAPATISMVAGKTVNARGKVSGSNVIRELRYELVGNESNFVSVPDNFRLRGGRITGLTATPEENNPLKLVIRYAPFRDDDKIERPITVRPQS